MNQRQRGYCPLASPATLSQLECTTCKNTMHPPIHQCAKGHPFCAPCYERLTICRCNDDFLCEPVARLELLWARHAFPCRYHTMGCSFVARGPRVRKHEKRCSFGDERCPVHPFCTWRGRKEGFVRHCTRHHEDNVFLGAHQVMRYDLRGSSRVDQFHVIFAAHDELFRCSTRVDKVKGVAKWCVYYFGDSCWSRQYSYEIHFGDDEERRVRSTCVAFSKSGGSLADDEAVLTDVKMLSELADDGVLIFKVKIYDNEMDQLYEQLLNEWEC